LFVPEELAHQALDCFLTRGKQDPALLRGLSQPQYRLRVGDIRVFYDVTETAVEVLAIVPKAQAEAWLAAKGTPSPGRGVGAGKG
jgi:hypothetical protein